MLWRRPLLRPEHLSNQTKCEDKDSYGAWWSSSGSIPRCTSLYLGFFYLPHKMAPGLGNGPWKWLLPRACSALYRLEFFMWQLGCWDIHPRGCALIKDSSSGRFLHCFLWPLTSFSPVGLQLHTTALLLGLPVTPNNALGSSHDSSVTPDPPARPPPKKPLPSCRRVG